MEPLPLNADSLALLADAAGSRADLARAAGVSRSMLSQILSGQRGTVNDSTEAIVRALGYRLVLVPLDAEQAAK
jgi:transcriptional regulator with XRE-family HTH domain